MIICSNCGATNGENEGKICRKCGALLPINTRPPRLRIQPNNVERRAPHQSSTNQPTTAPVNNNNQDRINQNREQHSRGRVPSQVQFFSGNKKKEEEVPIEHNLSSIPDPEIIEQESSIPQPSINRNSAQPSSNNIDFLQEVKPQPYSGSIMANKGVYSPQEIPRTGSSPTPQLSAIPTAGNVVENQMQQQERTKSVPEPQKKEVVKDRKKLKQLEDDMSGVLSVLSQKIAVPKEVEVKIKKPIPAKKEEEIPPASMNEILKQITTTDIHIEAAAIIKTDGTILASAVSHRISDTLFSVIAQNLSMIGTDIIGGLSAGILKSIQVKGSEGVIDLAPIDKKSKALKDLLLIILSSPKVKSGVINIAVSIVKKQVKKYLGIEH